MVVFARILGLRCRRRAMALVMVPLGVASCSATYPNFGSATDTDGLAPDPGGPNPTPGTGTDETGDGDGDGDGAVDPCEDGPDPGEVCLWFDRVLPTNNVPTAVLLADADRDTDIDVLITTFEGDDLLLYRNMPDLAFGTAETTVVGTGHRDLVASDFDEDGKIDLVLANLFTRSINLLPGNGDGTFGAPMLAGGGFGMPRHLDLEDVDDDGYPELLAANEDGGVLVFPGAPLDMGGPFGQALILDAGMETYEAYWADMDGDDQLDIVAVNRLSDDVSVLFADGTGGWETAVQTPVGSGPRGMDVADLDGDDDLDVVVANWDDGTMTTLLNDGAGNLVEAGPPVEAGLEPYTVKLADMDEDGDLDALFPVSGVNAVAVIRNEGGGTWGARAAFLTGDRPIDLVVADLDGDGRNEVLTVDTLSLGVTVFRSTPP